MRVAVGRVRHHECTESRCGDWHGQSLSGAEDTSVYSGTEPKYSKERRGILPKMGEDLALQWEWYRKPKEESFKKKVGKVANVENVLIVFAFNFIVGGWFREQASILLKMQSK